MAVEILFTRKFLVAKCTAISVRVFLLNVVIELILSGKSKIDWRAIWFECTWNNALCTEERGLVDSLLM